MLELLYKLFRQHPGVCTDSRQVVPGSLFFALKGDNFDGNRYACAALEKGAICAVIDDSQFASDHRCLLVDDVLTTLQELANHHRKQMAIPFIGITGSNGKTTTKELVSAVLATKYKTRYTQGNLNNHIGVPLTLLSVTDDDEMAVIEMGANHQGEIAHLCTIAQPDSGLITNIGRAHLGGFGGFAGVIKAKTELYRHLSHHNQPAFVNGDNPLLMTQSANLMRITYGTNKEADINGRIIHQGAHLMFAFTHEKIEYEVKTQFIGEYNFENVMAAVAVGLSNGIEPLAIKKAIEHYKPSNHRSQWIETERNQVVMDSYNANPSSMEAAIEVFAGINTTRPRVLILGEMLELGSETEKEHRNIVKKACNMKPDRLILLGEGFKEMHTNWFKCTDDLIASFINEPVNHSLILIKGSRGNHLEKLLPSL